VKTSDFDYYLPKESIAQVPVEPRDQSRLMVIDRAKNNIEHTRFCNIDQYLDPGDLLVINETRVIRARLIAKKYQTGGKAEILLLKQTGADTWEVIVKGKGLTKGKKLVVQDGSIAEIISVLDRSHRIIRFDHSIEESLNKIGQVPLPPYIHESISDPDRYQTIYAKYLGSAAAPTAGLHFTDSLFRKLIDKGIKVASITLHIGLDTFAPVTEEIPSNHQIHEEWCYLSREAAFRINQTHKTGGRIIAVGTTSVRTLETAAIQPTGADIVKEFEGPTGLYILPGYTFRVVDALITNFHLPKSTLIMLVSAFAGKDKIIEAYGIAQKSGYRFYSFGDAMLIL